MSTEQHTPMNCGSTSTSLSGASQQLVMKLVQLFKQVEMNPFHEFEVKFGKIVNGHFSSGITAEQFEFLFQWLNTALCWDSIKHHEYVDYEFKNNIRGTGGLFQHDMGFIGKHLNSHLDVSVQENLNAGCRFSLKTEIPCRLEIGRDIGTYTSVRVKQRSSFIFQCWSMDLTRIWTGSDPWSALSSQTLSNPLLLPSEIPRDRSPDLFEMEIEYLPNWWKENPYHSNSIPFHHYLANSFLGKIIDVLIHGRIIPGQTQIKMTIQKEIQVKLQTEN